MATDKCQKRPSQITRRGKEIHTAVYVKIIISVLKLQSAMITFKQNYFNFYTVM